MSNEENKKAENTMVFNEGTIMATARGDKFSTDVKLGYSIEDVVTNYRVNVKKQTMFEIAELADENDSFNILIRNGWESNGDRMPAGAGIAAKFEKDGEFYNCIFLESEMGKQFDKNKILRRSYIKLNAEHLDAIFTFLRYDDKVVKAKAEALKLQRTTLELGL